MTMATSSSSSTTTTTTTTSNRPSVTLTEDDNRPKIYACTENYASGHKRLWRDDGVRKSSGRRRRERYEYYDTNNMIHTNDTILYEYTYVYENIYIAFVSANGSTRLDSA
jgi:hypothetical protein